MRLADQELRKSKEGTNRVLQRLEGVPSLSPARKPRARLWTDDPVSRCLGL